jgi:hypothetical protein
MNIKVIALAAIIGLSTPTVMDISNSHPVLAEQKVFDYPDGTFGDQEWSIALIYSDNAYTYSGTNEHTGNNIYIDSEPKLSGNRQRQMYTWKSGKHRYQVTWRPRDPNFIRVQVINPNGKEILNRLLQKQ